MFPLISRVSFPSSCRYGPLAAALCRLRVYQDMLRRQLFVSRQALETVAKQVQALTEEAVLVLNDAR